MKTKVRSLFLTQRDLDLIARHFTFCYYQKFLKLFDITPVNDFYAVYQLNFILDKSHKRKLLTIVRCFSYAIFGCGRDVSKIGYSDYFRLLDLQSRFSKCLMMG